MIDTTRAVDVNWPNGQWPPSRGKGRKNRMIFSFFPMTKGDADKEPTIEKSDIDFYPNNVASTINAIIIYNNELNQ